MAISESHKNFIKFISFWVEIEGSRRNLSQKWGIGITTISNWLKGGSPQLYSLEIILEKTGLSWEDFAQILSGIKQAKNFYSETIILKKDKKPKNKILEDTKILSEEGLVLNITITKLK